MIAAKCNYVNNFGVWFLFVRTIVERFNESVLPKNLRMVSFQWLVLLNTMCIYHHLFSKSVNWKVCICIVFLMPRSFSDNVICIHVVSISKKPKPQKEIIWTTFILIFYGSSLKEIYQYYISIIITLYLSKIW